MPELRSIDLSETEMDEEEMEVGCDKKKITFGQMSGSCIHQEDFILM